jgi:hypothetical protein
MHALFAVPSRIDGALLLNELTLRLPQNDANPLLAILCFLEQVVISDLNTMIFFEEQARTVISSLSLVKLFTNVLLHYSDLRGNKLTTLRRDVIPTNAPMPNLYMYAWDNPLL